MSRAHTAANGMGEQPPPGVQDRTLWCLARRNQTTHAAQAGEAGATFCVFCRTPWPCEPRINADDALAASLTPGPAPTTLGPAPWQDWNPSPPPPWLTS